MPSNLQREKWDWALPDELLRTVYASLYLNLEEALSCPAPGLAYTLGQDRTLAAAFPMILSFCIASKTGARGLGWSKRY